MARNRPVLDSDQYSSAGERSGALNRRSYLKLTGGAAAAAVASTAIPSVSASDDDLDVISIDYEQYNQPSDVYRVWTCNPRQASFTSEQAHSGSRSLEIALSAGGSCGTNTHFNVENELGYQPRELYDSFMFKLSDNWRMADRDQCKISRAAMSYSAGDGHSGGDSATGTNGWSAGLVLANRGAGARNGGPYNLAAYVYHLDSRAQDNSGPWETAMIEPGRWYHIEQYVRLNTVDSNGNPNRDGVYRVWVDGDLAFERNYRWTTDLTNNAIEYCGPYIRYGGGETAPRNMAAYYDDHTMYIGGMPDSNERSPDAGDRPDDDPDPLEEYDERLTYRDPEQESDYRLYVDGEIIQHDWSQATLNDTVEITEEGGYQVVTATSPAENVDGYVFNGDVVAIASEYEPMMWISGERIYADDYPDVPADLEENVDDEGPSEDEPESPDDDSASDDRESTRLTLREYLEWLRQQNWL
ncbi:hypothetical protein [Natronobeatus ordinarius]|uniref:hypothetical protein n=1 Tax=Natronobeatus ordinarius TaxID=2963433 RepID=UPI0020CCE59B|nr:hypothetical protein [Natronobeatus ordinarius]